jgi:hypothetical protein
MRLSVTTEQGEIISVDIDASLEVRAGGQWHGVTQQVANLKALVEAEVSSQIPTGRSC